MSAVLPESSTLCHSAASAVDENSAWMRATENCPSAKNALPITVTVGMIRKITTTARNGSSGSPSLSLRTSADRLRPVLRQVLGGLAGLIGGRHSHRAIDDRDLARDRLVHRAGLQ